MSIEEKEKELRLLELELLIIEKKNELKKYNDIGLLNDEVDKLGFFPFDTIIVECRDIINVVMDSDIIDAQRIDYKLCCFTSNLSSQMSLVEIENNTENNILVVKIENKKKVDISKSYEGKLDILSNSVVNGGLKASHNEKKLFDNDGTRMTVQRYLKGTTNKIRLNNEQAKLIIFLEKHKKLVSQYINIEFQNLMI